MAVRLRLAPRRSGQEEPAAEGRAAQVVLPEPLELLIPEAAEAAAVMWLLVPQAARAS